MPSGGGVNSIKIESRSTS